MKENLDVGVMIPANQEQTNNGIIEKYYLNNDSLNYSHLGAMYEWDEAMQYSGISGSQGICPPGWHIPTIKEFDSLKANVNFDGRKLLAVGQGSGSGAGNNSTGFSALYSGSRAPNGSSYLAPPQFWTSSNTPGGIYSVGIENNSSLCYSSLIADKYGYTIRCIKNIN